MIRNQTDSRFCDANPQIYRHIENLAHVCFKQGIIRFHG